MQYTRLGSSGLKIGRITMGAMSFGDGSRETWAFGASEEIVGRAIKQFTRRDDIVPATKVHPTHA